MSPTGSHWPGFTNQAATISTGNHSCAALLCLPRAFQWCPRQNSEGLVGAFHTAAGSRHLTRAAQLIQGCVAILCPLEDESSFLPGALRRGEERATCSGKGRSLIAVLVRGCGFTLPHFRPHEHHWHTRQVQSEDQNEDQTG